MFTKLGPRERWTSGVCTRSQLQNLTEKERERKKEKERRVQMAS